MPKPLALSIAVCLGLTGCQVFERSEAWKQAVNTRPTGILHDPDPSQAYAAQLHRALADRGIEHKVVTYQFRYTTRLREEAVGTRTAVVYRDAHTPSHPWWLKDDRRNLPFWLPNRSLDQQISFYIRRRVEVLEQENYPARGTSGKATAARTVPRKKIAATSPAARSFFRPVVREEPNSWTPPELLAPVEPTPDTSLAKRFRAKHGTPFNPASATDRRKMAELQQGRLTAR